MWESAAAATDRLVQGEGLQGRVRRSAGIFQGKLRFTWEGWQRKLEWWHATVLWRFRGRQPVRFLISQKSLGSRWFTDSFCKPTAHLTPSCEDCSSWWLTAERVLFFVLPLLALVHGDSWSARLLTADDVARSVMLVFFMECGRAVSPFVTEAFFAQHGECPHKTPNMLTGPTPKESRGLG